MNSYELSRIWFDFCFENPEKTKPIHTAIYFFAIDHCNRLGGKEKFGFPSLHVMEAISVKSKNTYYKAFNDIVDWGFFKIIEKAKNQNSANIISISAISKNKSAHKSARDMAAIQQVSQQEHGTCVGGGNIDKPINHITNKPSNKEKSEKEKIDFDEIVREYHEQCSGLPQVMKITPKRKSAINARAKEHGKEKIHEVFLSASKSKFLNGENDRAWKADFDWLMNPNNFVKIMEGRYKNKKISTLRPTDKVPM